MDLYPWNDPRVGSCGRVGFAQVAGGAYGVSVPIGLPGLVNPVEITGEVDPIEEYGENAA